MVEHFFRREYGRWVAVLVRKVGAAHLELVEDAVQTAIEAALTTWTRGGAPDDPSAWLYRAAYNQLMGELRQHAARSRILERHPVDIARESAEVVDPRFRDEVRDDLLRMLFVCCDDVIPHDSRLILALKTLCGFSTKEIAFRLFTSEASVYKRLARARGRLRDLPFDLDTPTFDQLRARLPSVHAVLYLLLNEGYLSAHAEHAIRRELCDEAIRLTTLLAEHEVGAVPETFALLALMHFHVARLASRVDGMGGMLLLEEQDRSRWHADRVRTGVEWLARSATGNAFSRYHAEAGIAAEHCLAPSFAETRWSEIVELYVLLDTVAPSPLNALNKAVAMAEWKGPAKALDELRGTTLPAWLAGSYLWDAVLSDLLRRIGDVENARRHATKALESAPTDAVRVLLRRRLSG